MKNHTTSVCVWKGESLYDGKAIMLLLSGLIVPSANPKTGTMIQSYILREDVAPHKAVWDNEDASICGDCKLRNNRWGKKGEKKGCYVNVARAVLTVWKSYKKGNVPFVSPEKFVEEGWNLFERPIRQGAYGDPSFVPYHVWETIGKSTSDTPSSYTHMWQKEWFDRRHLEVSMASVDTLAEKTKANEMGARSYRIIDDISELAADEIQCPNNYDKKIQCMNCGLCSGERRKGAKNIATLRIDYGSG